MCQWEGEEGASVKNVKMLEAARFGHLRFIKYEREGVISGDVSPEREYRKRKE